MPKSMIELVVGNLEEKRTYRQMMRRVGKLPEDYRYTFKNIQKYMYNFGEAGCDMTMLLDLTELFEVSASEGKDVLDVVGSDVAGFCDELVSAAVPDVQTARQKLNQEILNYFEKEENHHDQHHS